MNSATGSWEVRVLRLGRKGLRRAPEHERARLVAALEEMRRDPFAGDVQPLTGQPGSFRRRVGNWRIFFDLDRVQRVVEVRDILRRTTTTYRKR